MTFRQINHPRAVGYAAKVHAIYHSHFEQILFLDADNVPVRDPSYLFELPEYLRSGAVFWPDYWHPDHSIFFINQDSLVWQLLDLPPNSTDTFPDPAMWTHLLSFRSSSPRAKYVIQGHWESQFSDKRRCFGRREMDKNPDFYSEKFADSSFSSLETSLRRFAMEAAQFDKKG